MHANCTCPETVSHAAELCLSCELEYINWLESNASQAREFVSRHSTQQLAELAERAA